MSLCDVIKLQKEILAKLENIVEVVTETKAELSDAVILLEQLKAAKPEAVEAGVVELKPYHYIFYIDTLLRWLEHIGIVTPTLIEIPITVDAGASGYVDFWLPKETACIERMYELYFPTSKGLKYGWMVDSTTEWAVPKHYFIPNKSYTEESIFGKYWIKWYFLRFHYEAIDPGQIVIRTWARLIKHRDLDKLLRLASPLAEMFEVIYPPPRVTPLVSSSELIKECRVCRAKMLREDDKIIRVGQWGRRFTDHRCEVFR